MGDLTVFTARSIVTMEPALPTATAVAVLDGRIASVGSLESLTPWIDAHRTTIDRRFDDLVLLPGLIDPHVHPFLPAVLSQMPFAAPEEWRLPRGVAAAVTTRDEWLDRVRHLADAHDDPDVPFFTWGYHDVFHGPLDRATLDAEVTARTPAFVWHRSFHEIVANTAGLQWLDLDPGVAGRPGVDLVAGRFRESGLGVVLGRVAPIFFAPERIERGMATFAEMLHRGGVTTAADMGLGIYGDLERELDVVQRTVERDGVPLRILLTPIINAFLGRAGPEESVAECRALAERSGDRVRIANHMKSLADGAFFSQLMKLSPPGYVDGHDGEWIVPPDVNRAWLRPFWDAGFQIHLHTNGDVGVGFGLDLLAELQEHRPRVDHRFTFEHYGYATDDQGRRLAALGAAVSANPYYVHALGDAYGRVGLGADRAAGMTPIGSLVSRGVPVAVHSDCPMAPLEPLTLAWCAATRRTRGGRVLAPAERLDLDAALRAVTTDAAWILRMEDEVGSIRAGKRADFTVVDADPRQVGVEGLRDLHVLATVFEGTVHPLG